MFQNEDINENVYELVFKLPSLHTTAMLLVVKCIFTQTLNYSTCFGIICPSSGITV
jgi:hypothetical protein